MCKKDSPAGQSENLHPGRLAPEPLLLTTKSDRLAYVNPFFKIVFDATINGIVLQIICC